MDDVILAHKPRQLNVAAQLMKAQLTCSLGFGYRWFSDPEGMQG